MESFDPTSCYVELRGDGTGAVIEDLSTFWPDLMEGRRQLEGRLVAGFAMKKTWAHWEMHPAGEELLVLLSGAVELVLDHAGTHTVVTLEPGRALLVPRGIWHTANVKEPGTLLGVTFGEGTQHRPR